MKFSKWLLYLRVFGGKAAQFLVFLALAALNLIPFLWGFITSLKSAREVLAYPPQISGFAVSWEHYANIIASGFLQSLKVNTFYCFSAIGIGLLLGLMIAYSLKRYQYKGRKLIFYLVLCAIPLSSGSAAMVVPNYVFFTEIGFSNQWYTMPILYTAYNLPMAIWIIMGGIEGIPLAIEESMIIDGANRLYNTTRLIDEAIRILQDSGKSIGISTANSDRDTLEYWLGKGINMISAGTDYLYVTSNAKKTYQTLTDLFHKKEEGRETHE